MNWKERVYLNIMKVWMSKRHSNEMFSAADIGKMLMEDLQSGMFYQNLTDAFHKTIKFRFFYKIWTIKYHSKKLLKEVLK